MLANTLQNKARFFALYWGQKVVISSSYVTQGRMYNHVNGNCQEYHYLELTPLSAITDKDAIELGKIALESDYDETVTDADCLKYCKESVLADETAIFTKETDFLRSKGYLLPFHDLTTDQLIEYGWAKLKTV